MWGRWSDDFCQERYRCGDALLHALGCTMHCAIIHCIYTHSACADVCKLIWCVCQTSSALAIVASLDHQRIINCVCLKHVCSSNSSVCHVQRILKWLPIYRRERTYYWWCARSVNMHRIFPNSSAPVSIVWPAPERIRTRPCNVWSRACNSTLLLCQIRRFVSMGNCGIVEAYAHLLWWQEWKPALCLFLCYSIHTIIIMTIIIMTIICIQ